MNDISSSRRPEATFPNLSEQVAYRISDAIIHGEYQPGEHLREQEFSDKYGVSRGTVREAMRILERDGVVDIIPRRGAVVTSLTADEIRETYEVREVLFGQAAALCAERKSDELIPILNEIVAEMAKKMAENEAADYAKLSNKLAMKVIAGSQNSRIQEIFVRMSLQIARYTNLGLSKPAKRKESLANWRRLIKCLAKGDAVEAEKVARTQIRRVKEHVIGLVADPVLPK